MKKIIIVLWCVLMAFLAANSSYAAQIDARTGMHFDWWESDNDDSGTQFYIPIRAASSYNDYSIELLGAYMFTQVNPDGGKRRSISQMTDTKLNLSYGIYDRLPFEVLFGLGFNLPTGHTDLSRSETALIVPPDLFAIPTFGEGLNINPTVTIAKELGRFIAGAGVGYTWRGKYDFDYQYTDYDPGDVLTLTGEVGYEITDKMSGNLHAQYVNYNEDTVDGDDFYQEGDVKLIGTGLSYTLENSSLSCNLTGILRDKSKVQQGVALPTEDRNSHGNELDAVITYRYHVDASTTLRTSLDLVFIDENDYPSASAYFVGKRQKITIGCGVDKILSETLTGSVGVAAFMMNDDENWYHPDEDLTYKGVSLSAQVGKKF